MNCFNDLIVLIYLHKFRSHTDLVFICVYTFVCFAMNNRETCNFLACFFQSQSLPLSQFVSSSVVEMSALIFMTDNKMQKFSWLFLRSGLVHLLHACAHTHTKPAPLKTFTTFSFMYLKLPLSHTYIFLFVSPLWDIPVVSVMIKLGGCLGLVNWNMQHFLD